jgi:hypothetical protein
MPNRQHAMGDRRAIACQALGQEGAITRGTPGILLTVDEQNRCAVQTGRNVVPVWRQRSE